MTTRHLDLGCGARPRNPYGRDELHGIDLAPRHEPGAFEVRRANLALEPIPYPDDHFDSVSAYDFLEHVPRVLPTADGRDTRFPFVELMNEVWRVLSPGGLLYAYTPCYPHPMAFKDPTHVNILTRDSHEYFTRPRFTARMYGFKGDFSIVRVMPALVAEHEYEPRQIPGWYAKYRLRRRERRHENTHVVWELAAHK
ncbi:MAG TPA: methyltransferase domain-containing protein [Rubrivivax sp.]|nr:class I SAM-dependent methyltransferase [Rubrivivax sp.]HRC36889.1 methyltransferase domain-containing protein [Rubrivivax sp.]